jgi:hypothetical protein
VAAFKAALEHPDCAVSPITRRGLFHGPISRRDAVYGGCDNNGKPKSLYLDTLKTLTDDKLADEAERKIWLSAVTGTNRRSDCHWQTSAIYDECERRGEVHLFEKARDSAIAQIRGS